MAALFSSSSVGQCYSRGEGCANLNFIPFITFYYCFDRCSIYSLIPLSLVNICTSVISEILSVVKNEPILLFKKCMQVGKNLQCV
jgi:hypothetical protein